MPSAGAPSLEKLATAVGWRDGRIRSFLNAAYGKPRTRRRCPSVRRTASMYATVSSFRRRGSLPGPATYGRLLDDACTLSDPSLFRAILRDVQEAGLPLTPDMLFQCMRHIDRHGDAARVVAYLNAYHSRGLALTQDVLSIVLRSLSAGSDFPGTAALFQQLSLRRAVDWACLVESCSLVPHALSLVALQQLDSGSVLPVRKRYLVIKRNQTGGGCVQLWGEEKEKSRGS
ncbi:hypothetical protein DIPPA_12179 [Diplonema papillatum]|nr:hypothetical protein DIPPA_12179 [Diplonema papillatum]